MSANEWDDTELYIWDGTDAQPLPAEYAYHPLIGRDHAVIMLYCFVTLAVFLTLKWQVMKNAHNACKLFVHALLDVLSKLQIAVSLQLRGLSSPAGQYHLGGLAGAAAPGPQQGEHPFKLNSCLSPAV